MAIQLKLVSLSKLDIAGTCELFGHCCLYYTIVKSFEEIAAQYVIHRMSQIWILHMIKQVIVLKQFVGTKVSITDCACSYCFSVSMLTL